MVIAVNGWMNHPGGLHARDGACRRRASVAALFGNSFFWHELVHMYIAGYIVAGFLVGGRLRVGAAARPLGPLRAHGAGDPADDRRAGLAGAGRSSATGRRARWRRRSRSSWRRSRAAKTTQAARPSTCSAGTTASGRVRDRDPEAALAARLPRPERESAGARRRAGRRPAAGQRRPLRVPDDGRDRHAAGAARRGLPRASASGDGGCRARAGSTAPCRWRPARRWSR